MGNSPTSRVWTFTTQVSGCSAVGRLFLGAERNRDEHDAAIRFGDLAAGRTGDRTPWALVWPSLRTLSGWADGVSTGGRGMSNLKSRAERLGGRDGCAPAERWDAVGVARPSRDKR